MLIVTWAINPRFTRPFSCWDESNTKISMASNPKYIGIGEVSKRHNNRLLGRQWEELRLWYWFA